MHDSFQPRHPSSIFDFEGCLDTPATQHVLGGTVCGGPGGPKGRTVPGGGPGGTRPGGPESRTVPGGGLGGPRPGGREGRTVPGGGPMVAGGIVLENIRFTEMIF